jgi:ribosomal protein L40E
VKGISVIVGEAIAGDGSDVPVYRALRSLLCSSCGAAIGEGALFTRRANADNGLRVAAQCRECVPFTLRDEESEGRRRSPLLESLFTPHAEGKRVRRESGPAAESVKERLGPALRYRAGKKGAGR